MCPDLGHSAKDKNPLNKQAQRPSRATRPSLPQRPSLSRISRVTRNHRRGRALPPPRSVASGEHDRLDGAPAASSTSSGPAQPHPEGKAWSSTPEGKARRRPLPEGKAQALPAAALPGAALRAVGASSARLGARAADASASSRKQGPGAVAAGSLGLWLAPPSAASSPRPSTASRASPALAYPSLLRRLLPLSSKQSSLPAL